MAGPSFNLDIISEDFYNLIDFDRIIRQEIRALNLQNIESIEIEDSLDAKKMQTHLIHKRKEQAGKPGKAPYPKASFGLGSLQSGSGNRPNGIQPGELTVDNSSYFFYRNKYSPMAFSKTAYPVYGLQRSLPSYLYSYGNSLNELVFMSGNASSGYTFYDSINYDIPSSFGANRARISSQLSTNTIVPIRPARNAIYFSGSIRSGSTPWMPTPEELQELGGDSGDSVQSYSEVGADVGPFSMYSQVVRAVFAGVKEYSIGYNITSFGAGSSYINIPYGREYGAYDVRCAITRSYVETNVNGRIDRVNDGGQAFQQYRNGGFNSTLSLEIQASKEFNSWPWPKGSPSAGKIENLNVFFD